MLSVVILVRGLLFSMLMGKRLEREKGFGGEERMGSEQRSLEGR